MAAKGVFVMISNSNTQFVQDLYDEKPFRKQLVYAKRSVSRDGKKRGLEGELLITTYEV
jgi:site-specific DNA-adenine methylase